MSRNFETNNLTITPLEAAKRKSMENLKAYGLDIISLTWEIYFISRMKDAFRNSYNMDSFNDYSPEFFQAVCDFQRKNNMTSNGVLDIDFLVKFDRQYPNVFSDMEKARILNYFQNREKYVNSEAKYIYTETQESIVKTELDLVDDIWMPKHEVFKFVKTELNLNWNVTEMRTQIVTFQKEHNLREADWKIWKETYYESLARNYFSGEKILNMNENGISKNDQKLILEIFENGRKWSPELTKISAFLEAFRQKGQTNLNFHRDYWEFYGKYDAIILNYKNSPDWIQDQKIANQRAQSFYSIAKDPNIPTDEKIKRIVTDPTVLMVGSLLFLFWVVGSDSKYTDSFLKRWAWLLWAGLFWPDIWNKLWLWEALRDAKKTISTVWDNVESGSGVRETQAAKTENFIKELPGHITQKLKDAWNYTSQAAEKWLESINSSFWAISAKNEALKKSKNDEEKEKYITDENFYKLSNNFAKDEKLFETSINDLEKAKTEPAEIKKYLSEDTKKALYPENQTDEEKQKMDKDLKNYVSLLLSEKDSDDYYIKDIIISKSIFSKGVDLLTSTVDYNEIPEINKKIEDSVSKISQKEESNVKLALFSITSNPWEKVNKLEAILKKEDLMESDKREIEILRDIYLIDKNYNDLIKIIDEADINWWENSLKKLEDSYNIFEDKTKNYNKKPGSVYDIYKQKIEEKYRQKQKEILEKMPTKTPEQESLLNEIQTGTNFEKNYSMIWALPNHDLKSYQDYLSNQRVLAYNSVLNSSFDWKFEDNWDVKIDEKWELIIKEGTPEKYIKVAKAHFTRIQFEKLSGNINLLAMDDIIKIKELQKEILETRDNPALFEVKKVNFENRAKDILNKIYPNQIPDKNSWIKDLISFFRGNNGSSVYAELANKLKAIDNSKTYDFDTKIMTSLTWLMNSFENEKTNNSNEIKKEELTKKVPEVYEIATSYNEFYNALPEELKSEFPAINSDDYKNMNIEWLISLMITFWNKIKNNKNIDKSKFENQYNDLTKKLEPYKESYESLKK